MRTLDLAEALAEADKQSGNGRSRVRDLAELCAPAGQLSIQTFREGDREAFLDVAWQEIPQTRFLSPASSPRTLRAVAGRILDTFGTFDALVRAPARSDFDPSWFVRCAGIERDGFDWSRFRPWLIPAVGDEKRLSPSTTLYVYEGVHSTMALAVGLAKGSYRWRPLEAIVSRQRPPW